MTNPHSHLPSPSHQLPPDTLPSLIAFRRDLHQHPELAFNETRTAQKISEYLTSLNIPHKTNIAQTGIIADIPGSNPNLPAIALRADIDALPIHEQTNLPFASQTSNVMHACGHDGHTTILLAAATILTNQPPLPTPVRLIFQPAEEIAAGAKAMIEQNALDHVALIFGGHLDRLYPAGQIIINDGPVNASSDTFKINITGKGGHAARPHEAVDAVIIGASLVTAIQSIISRKLDPTHPAVITVGRFDAGTKHNIIAESANLAGSIRTLNPKIQSTIHIALQQICDAHANLHNAQISLDIEHGSPALINDPQLTFLARNAAARTVGPENVKPMANINMGAEDFAYYLQHIPGCYVRIGAAFPDRDNPPAHSPTFNINEDAIPIAASYYATLTSLASQNIAAEN